MRASGLFVEMGPLLLSSLSVRTAAYNDTGVPTLYKNPYAWTKVANLLILNGPAPVGYSYCTPAGPSGDGNSCGCVAATASSTSRASTYSPSTFPCTAVNRPGRRRVPWRQRVGVRRRGRQRRSLNLRGGWLDRQEVSFRMTVLVKHRTPTCCSLRAREHTELLAFGLL